MLLGLAQNMFGLYFSGYRMLVPVSLVMASVFWGTYIIKHPSRINPNLSDEKERNLR